MTTKKHPIPPVVWRTCNRALQMHELRKKTLAGMRQDVVDEYQSPGGGNPPEVRAGGGSIYKSKLDSAIRKLTSCEIAQLEQDVQAIEDVLESLSENEKQFYTLHYCKHNTVGDCAWKMSFGRTAATKIKRRIIEKTAIRLGYL